MASGSEELQSAKQPNSDTEDSKDREDIVALRVHLDGLPLADECIDRSVETQRLWEQLRPLSEKPQRRLLLIHGEAGVGKSQLAAEFAKKYKDDFSSVFRVDGSAEESLKWSIASIQRHLKDCVFSPEAQSYAQSAKNLNQAVTEVLDWFNVEKNGRWLLVIDNLATEAPSSDNDSQNFNLKTFLPTADHGSVLITTRKPQDHEYGPTLKLEMLNAEHAEMLLVGTSKEKLQDVGAPGDIKQLLDLLGGSPIAIKQASAFMRETKASISNYLQKYQTTAKQLQESINHDKTPFGTSPTDSAPAVTTNISYEHIRNEDETAVKFLQLWTYLDNRDLWYELFTPDLALPVQPENLWWFRWAIRAPERFEQAMQKLQAYGMIQTKENLPGYFLHPVIHECAQQIVSTDIDPELAWLAVRTVGRATPSGSTEDEQHLKHRLSFHTDRCHRLVMEHVADPYFTLKNTFLTKGVKLDTALIYISAVSRLGKLFAEKQITSKANDLLLRASSGYTEILGPENETTLRTISSRAEILQSIGKSEEAEALFLQVARGAENTLGPSEPMTWTSFCNLSVAQQKLGKLDLAEETLRRVLGFMESAVGSDHPRAVRTVEALSSVTLLRGKYDEAVDLSLRALSSRKTSIGPDYFHLLESLLPLTVSCIYSNKPAEAEKVVLACLHEYEENSVSNVHVALGLVTEVAGLYEKQGKLEEASHMLLQAVEGYEGIPGDHQKEMADAAYNLATVYTFQNKPESAEKMVLTSIKGYNSALGADHHYTLDALSNLGNIQSQLGKTSEAEQTYLQALASKDRTLGLNHRKTLETVNNLGAFYAGQDNLVEAEKMYLRALDGFKTALGPTHSITLGISINIGSLYDSMDRRYDAVRSYLRALDGYQEVLLVRQNPTQVPDAGAAANGPTAGSGPAVNGYNTMYARFSGADDEPLSAFIPGLTATLGQLEKLAILHMKNMEWADAEDVYLRVLKAKELFLAPNHSSTLGTTRALARSLFFHCMLEAAAAAEPEQRLKPSQMNIGGWDESSPLWRLAYLAETYATSPADVLGMLGRTLLVIGDVENGKSALCFALVTATKITGATPRECGPCKTSITPTTGWYVCRSCTEDTDLCESCFGSRKDEHWQSPCRDHVFEAIVSTESVDDELLAAYSDPTPWLKSLKAYLKDGARRRVGAAVAV